METERLEASFTALNASLWSLIEARSDKFGKTRIRQPDLVPVADGYSDSKLGHSFPALRHLDQALEIAAEHGFREVVEAFSSVADRMPWSQNPRYTVEAGHSNLLNGYAYASLSGPEGPIRCMAPRGGFYLMGPNVNYPSHNHAPREVYLMMTPGVRWCLDDGDWFDTEAGDLIYHAPWQMHAMRSGDTPALAYVAWLEPGSRLDVAWGETDVAN